MKKTYVLGILGESGMYTYGDSAATPDLARACIGNLIRKDKTLCIKEIIYREDYASQSLTQIHNTIIAVEPAPGTWIIGTDAVTSMSASALGRKGGSVKSDAKSQASRDNGKKGGRPKTARKGE